MSSSKIIMAGFGGQGVMAMGQLITYAGMLEGKQVSYFPSYGPEMRGGAANCSVTVSDERIGAPNINIASDVVAMNLPSYEKFKTRIEKGGHLFVNSTLIAEDGHELSDVNVYLIPATGTAKEMGNPKIANMIMLGAFLEVTKVVSQESVLEAFTKVFGEKKAKFVPMNKEALERGASLVKK